MNNNSQCNYQFQLQLSKQINELKNIINYFDKKGQAQHSNQEINQYQSLKNKLIRARNQTIERKQVLNLNLIQSPIENFKIKQLSYSNKSCLQSPNKTSFMKQGYNILQNDLKLKTQSQDITAKNWIIYNSTTNKIIQGCRYLQKKEIASLTKIMTLYACLKITEQFNIPLKLQLIITKKSSQMIGTSANLLFKDVLSINQLFYALMLPSGNDAAQTLAEYFGLFLHYSEQGQLQKIQNQQFIYLDYEGCILKDLPSIFIKYMNQTAQALKLKHTQYNNSHGLADNKNKSTALDQAKLCKVAFQIDLIKEIVGKQSITFQVHNLNGQFRKLQLINTNKLLQNGYLGMKTGITKSAGPCLSSIYQENDQNYVIVVLQCNFLDDRFDDTTKLVETFIKNQLHES